MRRVQSKCREIAAPTGLGLPISFPFAALACLFQNGSSLTHFETPLTPVFLKACGRPIALSNSTSATGLSLRLIYPPREQPGSQNQTHSIALNRSSFRLQEVSPAAANCLVFLAFRTAPVRHSKRRISTGNRREAARAGSSVALIEIAIATTVIQTPSQTLG